MPVTRLTTHRVEKPWGRRTLWPGFDDVPEGGEPVGEIWFQTPGDDQPELLVKYLFTSERLSIQVHPDDAAARDAGYPRGKAEAWVILDAEPDSTIALGLQKPTTREHLRDAALDGSIETLVDWKPVAAGEAIYSPAGTVHAIGAGLTLVEVQQNVDLTYRLYDYGRPRELHLDAGIAVSDPVPFTPQRSPANGERDRQIIVEGPKFVLERWNGRWKWQADRQVALGDGRPGWFVPLAGAGRIDGEPWSAGECWLVEGSAAIAAGTGSDMLFAYPGAKRIG